MFWGFVIFPIFLSENRRLEGPGSCNWVGPEWSTVSSRVCAAAPTTAAPAAAARAVEVPVEVSWQEVSTRGRTKRTMPGPQPRILITLDSWYWHDVRGNISYS